MKKKKVKVYQDGGYDFHPFFSAYEGIGDGTFQEAIDKLLHGTHVSQQQNFPSDIDLEGLQSLNKTSPGIFAPLDHSMNTVGKDLGNTDFLQDGGFTSMFQSGNLAIDIASKLATEIAKRGKKKENIPLGKKFFLENSGYSKDEIELFQKSVAHHESRSQYDIEQNQLINKNAKPGPASGAYQFEGPSMKTAARKLEKVYKNNKKEVPKYITDIVKGNINRASKLKPEEQDELFYGQLIELRKGDLKPVVPGRFKNFDVNSPKGRADFWKTAWHRGTEDRRDSFMESESTFEYQHGGGIPTSVLGYGTDSPDKNLDMLRINSNNITMNNVDRPLILNPSIGKPIIAMPETGSYLFPGASYVDEIPLYQQGGQPEEMEPVKIQAEKGEMISFQDGTLVDSKATKKHEQMKDDEVTDILPPGSYVHSARKEMKIKKKDADKISFGLGPIIYEENEVHPFPEEEFFGDMFKNKEEIPADIAKRILKKFPTTDRENDIYSMAANQENLISRSPYLQALTHLSEMKKGRRDVAYNMQKGGSVAKAPLGAIMGLLSAAPGILDMFGIGSGAKAQKRIERNELLTQRELKSLQNTAGNRYEAGYATDLGSTMGQFISQDPNYTYLDRSGDVSRSQGIHSRNMQDIDTGVNLSRGVGMAPINTMMRNMSGDPRAAQTMGSSMYGQYLDSSNQMALNSMGARGQERTRHLDTMNAIGSDISRDRQQGANYTRSATNMLNQGLFKGIGDSANNYLTNMNSLDMSIMSAIMGSRNQTSNALNNLNFLREGRRYDSFKDAADVLGQYYNKG